MLAKAKKILNIIISTSALNRVKSERYNIKNDYDITMVKPSLNECVEAFGIKEINAIDMCAIH
ncbi:hypothetical protein [Thorsellia kenyensis]|uniref:hypothetical protein n=1 Tax=Thorsellia kenyensis TaxID=1549888 RepID=UPI0036D8B024